MICKPMIQGYNCLSFFEAILQHTMYLEDSGIIRNPVIICTEPACNSRR